MAVILKKDEKIGNVANSLPDGFTVEEFIDSLLSYIKKITLRLKRPINNI